MEDFIEEGIGFIHSRRQDFDGRLCKEAGQAEKPYFKGQFEQ